MTLTGKCPLTVLPLLALLALSVPSPARAAEEKGAVEGERIGSIHALIGAVYKEALAWSPGAKLYSISGKGPKNKAMWADEEWRLEFGDPVAEDGYFVVEFRDSVVIRKEIVRGKDKVVETYFDGKFQQSNREKTSRAGAYPIRRPLGSDFLDGPDLQEVLGVHGFGLSSYGQYEATLIHSLDFGKYSFAGAFVIGGSLPKSLWGRTIWAVSNEKQQIFLDAKTGRKLLIRPFRL